MRDPGGEQQPPHQYAAAVPGPHEQRHQRRHQQQQHNQQQHQQQQQLRANVLAGFFIFSFSFLVMISSLYVVTCLFYHMLV